ncbi:MAG: hypothetical protein ACJAUZ_000927, partial [Flavobacteriaceae bacterium]
WVLESLKASRAVSAMPLSSSSNLDSIILKNGASLFILPLKISPRQRITH